MIEYVLTGLVAIASKEAFDFMLKRRREEKKELSQQAYDRLTLTLAYEEEKAAREYKLQCEHEFEEWDTAFYEDHSEWQDEEAEISYKRWKAKKELKQRRFDPNTEAWIRHNDYMQQMSAHQ